MNNKATFGGGCFWCLDAIFRRTKGVSNVVSGYSGGHLDNPRYEDTHHSRSGHAESVQIEFDPEAILYEVILEIFWTSHNPTTLNQDGANVGTEYRSVIFYHDENQRLSAEASKIDVAQNLWTDPIVTEIVPFEKFWSGEDYHQDYYNKNTNAGYCQTIINPKLEKFRKRFSEYVKE